MFKTTDEMTDIKYRLVMLTESRRPHVEEKETESSLE